jgi:hypothetical protein
MSEKIDWKFKKSWVGEKIFIEGEGLGRRGG